jgi:hypothetical protein
MNEREEQGEEDRLECSVRAQMKYRIGLTPKRGKRTEKKESTKRNVLFV